MATVPLVPPPGSVHVVYRDVNERILAISAELFALSGEQEIEILCECPSTTCCGRIQIAAVAYEELRDQPGRFAVIPGHERLEGERIVLRRPMYSVIEKDAAILHSSGYPAGQVSS